MSTKAEASDITQASLGRSGRGDVVARQEFLEPSGSVARERLTSEERPTRAHRGGSPLRGFIPGRRFVYGLLVTAVLAASGCGEGPPPEVNEPPEVAKLRAAGKNPREIRDELKALELKKALKGAPIPVSRTN